MTKINAVDCYPLVLPVREIYGGTAGFLEDWRSLIFHFKVNGKKLKQNPPGG